LVYKSTYSTLSISNIEKAIEMYHLNIFFENLLERKNVAKFPSELA
jgi:hypothetical protein